MNARSTGRGRQYVVRDTGTLVVFLLAVAVMLFLLGDSIVRGNWAFVGLAAPLGLFIAWALWMVLVHPHVRYDTQGAVVVNVGRVHELPWGQLSAVRQRLGIVFELKDGTRVIAAGASAPRGMGTVAGAVTGRLGNDSENFNRNADPLEQMRAAAAPTDAQVVHRWDVVPLAIGAVLAVAAIVDIAATALAA